MGFRWSAISISYTLLTWWLKFGTKPGPLNIHKKYQLQPGKMNMLHFKIDPIEKEHHLKQTSILRVQNVHFPGCTALPMPYNYLSAKKTLKNPSDRLAPRGFWSSSQHRGRQAKESRCGILIPWEFRRNQTSRAWQLVKDFSSTEFIFQYFRIQKIKTRT